MVSAVCGITNLMSTEHRNPAPATSRVSDEQHAQVASAIEAFRDVIGPSFQLPSEHALTCYVTSCFAGFIRNLPFIHHTRSVAGCERV